MHGLQLTRVELVRTTRSDSFAAILSESITLYYCTVLQHPEPQNLDGATAKPRQ